MASSWIISSVMLGVEDGRLATMGRVFVIAIVVVVPFLGWRARPTIRRWRDRRADLRAAESASAPQSRIPPPESLAAVLASLENQVTSQAEPVELVVPSNVTIEGHPAPDPVVQTVLSDAIRRSGLRVISDFYDASGARNIICTSSLG